MIRDSRTGRTGDLGTLVVWGKTRESFRRDLSCPSTTKRLSRAICPVVVSAICRRKNLQWGTVPKEEVRRMRSYKTGLANRWRQSVSPNTSSGLEPRDT